MMTSYVLQPTIGLGYRRLRHVGCQHQSEAWWRRCRRFLLTSRAPSERKSGGGFPTQTSSVVYGRVSETSATCTGCRRKPWRTSCRKARGTESFEQENKVPQGSRLRTYCQHTTPNRQAQTKPSTDWGSWKNGYAMTGTSLLCKSSPRCHPRGAQATNTGKRRRDVLPKPSKEVNRDQVPLPS